MGTITLSPQVLDKKRVADLLCSAFKGGSNYWYQIEDEIAPPEGKLVRHTGLDETFPHIDYPLSDGGALMVSDANGADAGEVRTVRLDLASITKGLEIMRDKEPRHFGAWLAEEDDGDTGDVFLQCCLFGEVIYG